MNHTFNKVEEYKNKKKKNNNEIDVIFTRIGNNDQVIESVVVQCLPDDMVAFVIEQYRKKTGDKLRYKILFLMILIYFPVKLLKILDYTIMQLFMYINNE